MQKDWNIVEVLKHSRHDWLNKIQLIKGNLALNRTDRVKEIIDEIVMEAQNESKLTNLELEKFASLLMTYNWEQPKYKIEYEVIGDIVNLAPLDEILSTWFGQFFSILDELVDYNGENILSISIETFVEEIRFLFDFSGIIKNTDGLITWLDGERPELDKIHVLASEVHSEEFTATIHVTLPE